jgi:hypothetical protein
MSFSDFLAAVTAGEAEKYLAHRYEAPDMRDFPLPDEGFISEWDAWLNGRDGGFPGEVRALFSGKRVKVWLEATPAGRIPVVYAEDRPIFERLTAFLNAEDDPAPLPASVNAFTVPGKRPPFKGHRAICLARAGYSALSGENVGVDEDEWTEKSAAIRLHHECCHYFTLRVLGGMKNHALDEVAADCAGQLAAFGRYDASLQRKFFGMDEEGRIAPGGRLGFYVKRLPEDAIPAVCRKVNEALNGLEGYLAKNPEMTRTRNRPELIVKLAVLGIPGIAELD